MYRVFPNTSSSTKCTGCPQILSHQLNVQGVHKYLLISFIDYSAQVQISVSILMNCYLVVVSKATQMQSQASLEWEFIKENKKLSKRRKKTRSPPRKRSRRRSLSWSRAFFLDHLLGPKRVFLFFCFLTFLFRLNSNL